MRFKVTNITNIKVKGHKLTQGKLYTLLGKDYVFLCNVFTSGHDANEDTLLNQHYNLNLL